MQKTALGKVARAPLTHYRDAAELVLARRPAEPVYCLYPHVARAHAREFLTGFPGDVLYAVKSNPAPELLDVLYAAGVRHYDTASLPEIRLVRERFPEARCYFMAPVRPIGAAAEAYRRWGIKDFVIDSHEEFEKTLSETGSRDITLFVRLKTDVGGAVIELSSKFGAHEFDAVHLLRRVAESGCRPAIAFHVGSLCLDADAFARALEICRDVLALADVPIVSVDVGGGFPAPYPGTSAPPPAQYFERIKEAAAALNLGPEVRLICEPGRGLSAHAISLVTQVIGRRGDRLYLNDGIYGSFAEMMIPNSRFIYPARVMRIDGEGLRTINSSHKSFIVYGPTCDSVDMLPHPLDLPTGTKTGDFIEFGLIGSYSYANRTAFNGFYPDEIVEIGEASSLPPGVTL